MASKLHKESGKVQVNFLLYALGREAKPIHESFVYYRDGNREIRNINLTVIRKFDEHFVPRRNIIHDHACFHKYMLKPGETSNAFVRSLYEPNIVNLE